MTQSDRGRMIVALLLILAGLYFFAIQFIPALRVFSLTDNNWPLIVVGVGVALLVATLLTWTPSFMIPAAIVTGIGALLFWQNATNNWASWAYAWTLIPGFVGVGVFLMHVMQGNLRQGILTGGAPALVSLVMFAIFGSFFGALGFLGQYWPLLLIVVGVIVLARAF